jgi:deoxyribonuclease V
VTVAFLDVHYEGSSAHAACVVAESWESETPHSSYVADIKDVAPYQPGSFYRRELPCLVAVLRLLTSLPDAVVIDGYVWLPPLGQPGLGARLYETLGRNTPVVGIAKTAFAGVGLCSAVVPILRGTSRNPLFVTAVGMAPEVAAQCVGRMAGKHRIPEILRITDSLSRGLASAGNTAL